jgi:hypothetical protein
MLLERKRKHAKCSKEHHFGRWFPFARQHFQYPLYIFSLYIQDSARGPPIVMTLSLLHEYSRHRYIWKSSHLTLANNK